MTDTWQWITMVRLNQCQNRTQLLLVCLAHLKRTISSNSSPLKRGWYAAESVLRNSTAGEGRQSLALQERPRGQQQEPGKHFRGQGLLLSYWESCCEIRMNSTAEPVSRMNSVKRDHFTSCSVTQDCGHFGNMFSILDSPFCCFTFNNHESWLRIIKS